MPLSLGKIPVRADLGVLLGVAVIVRVFWFTGPWHVDDLTYAELASDILRHGWPERDSIWNLRVGFTGSLVLSTAIFGVSSFSLALPSLIASTALVGLVHAIALRMFDRVTARLAGLAVCLHPLDVFFATGVHADLCLAALTAGAFLLLLPREETPGWKRFAVAGLLLGAGHLFKALAILPLLVLIGFLLIRKVPRGRVAAVMAGFGTIVAAEGLAYWILRGNPFHRIAVTQAEQAEAMLSPFFVRHDPTAYRLFLEFPDVLFNPLHPDFVYSGLLHWGFLVAVVFLVRSRRSWGVPLAAWWGGMFLLMNFWPITISPFRPAMTAMPWIFVHLTAPAAIAVAAGLRHLWERSRWGSSAAGGVMAAAAVLASASLWGDTASLQFPIRRALEAIPPEQTVCTDPRTARLMHFYEGHPEPSRIRSWHDPVPDGEWYYVEFPVWWELFRTEYGWDMPPHLRTAPERGERLLEESSRGRIRLRALMRGRVEFAGRPPLRLYRLTGGPSSDDESSK